ncbi:hypothetical protein [Patiriisocius sp. Uisw_017]|jgi:hypothetical protein|uniref:hypothetical protein n=1 Tax=Patiriisocius sp. Uisw_017 TaxID=3230968 RepID=UPI0039EAF3C0
MLASFAKKATENRLSLLSYEKDRKIGVEIVDLFEEDGSAKGMRVILSIPTNKSIDKTA